jgi:hypothetical protein
MVNLYHTALKRRLFAEVRIFANADVPQQPSKANVEEASLPRTAKVPIIEKRRIVERQLTIKRSQVAKRRVPAGRNAYAADFNFFSSPPFGSY